MRPDNRSTRSGPAAALLLAVLLALPPGSHGEEQLTLPAPDGWQTLYAMESSLLRLSEFAAPGGEGVVDKYTFEWFADGLAEDLDPVAVARQLGGAVRQGCSGGADQGVFAGFENGYPTVVRLFTCPRSNGEEHGEILLAKTIQGATGTWVIVRARRVPAYDDGGLGLAEAEIGAWSLAMRSITLCDPDADEHPCPAAGSDAAGNGPLPDPAAGGAREDGGTTPRTAP